MASIIECSLTAADSINKNKIPRCIPTTQYSHIIYMANVLNLGMYFDFNNIRLINGTLYQYENISALKILFYCTETPQGYAHNIGMYVINYFMTTPGVDISNLYTFLNFKSFQQIQLDSEWKERLLKETCAFICDLIEPINMFLKIKRCGYTTYNQICQKGLYKMKIDSNYTNGQINSILDKAVKVDWKIGIKHSLYIMTLITQYQLVNAPCKSSETTALYMGNMKLEPILFPQAMFFMLLCILTLDNMFDIKTLPIV